MRLARLLPISTILLNLLPAQDDVGFALSKNPTDSAVDAGRIELISKLSDERGTHFTIRNRSKLDLVAVLLVSAHWDKNRKQVGEGRMLLDALTNHITFTPVRPNEVRVVTLPAARSPGPNAFSAMLAAGVFSDGTATGRPESINIIRRQRGAYATSYRKIVSILENALATSPGDGTRAIKELSDSALALESRETNRYLSPYYRLTHDDCRKNLEGIAPGKPMERRLQAMLARFQAWLSELDQAPLVTAG